MGYLVTLGSYIESLQANTQEDDCYKALQAELDQQKIDADFNRTAIDAIFNSDNCHVN